MMAQTDRQTDKTTRWAFTAYEPQWDLFKQIPDIVKEWGWQTEECPETKRKHYQGYIMTRTQQRHSAMRKALPGVHIEAARNWSALLNYCKKEESAVPGTQVKQENSRKYLQFSDALMRIANAYIAKPIDNELATYEEWFQARFAAAVMDLLVANPDDVSLYSNPQVFRAWKLTHAFWLRKVYHSQEVCPIEDCEFCEYSQRANEEGEFRGVVENIFECCGIVEDGQEGRKEADEARSSPPACSEDEV